MIVSFVFCFVCWIPHNTFSNAQSDRCSNAITCQHEGYQDPNNCYKCKCPDGLAGDHCDRLQPSVNGKDHILFVDLGIVIEISECANLSDHICVCSKLSMQQISYKYLIHKNTITIWKARNYRNSPNISTCKGRIGRDHIWRKKAFPENIRHILLKWPDEKWSLWCQSKFWKSIGLYTRNAFHG